MSKEILVDAEFIAFAESKKPKNKYLRHITFVFADDRPNNNNQVISHDEFDALKESAIGMPIKMRFLGSTAGAGNHAGSIPIGHISDMTEDELEDGTHRLIAEGSLYAFEYPDEIEYLEQAYEAKKAPGLSWELAYETSIIDKGLELLKGVIAMAATFVRHPAYGKRTALLALASDNTLSDEQVEQEVASLFANIEIEGGTNEVTLEEAQAEIQQLKEQLAAAQTENTSLKESADKVPDLETAHAELQGKVQELTEKVEEYEITALITDRTQKMVAAGFELSADTAEVEKKQKVWASMAEEVFEEYVSDISAVAKKTPKRAEASARPVLGIPKPSSDGTAPVSYSDLKNRMAAMGHKLPQADE